ncbi:coniferyl aldehyde dehydrogenase [Herbaspirillum rubrisubalbicans]|uniref:Aldehyde dehydrogenase n=1 Tax=Herbaspirillum rubrisubalbicans Os34 TaxID=1235827 RepID=A0A6M3ZWE6_9BURK|nr:coniferyl aldehyde dehydrogenase [Herbaspirillum rubrisubalbicans]MCP1574492.1 coniferyl-aldehyde dehydrogenase [Herbaspirillum rubrisubalbicans]QJQ02964.1 coniferyl aldehyde dehydrogenase [Herbaspirillum rubrisubalbicans Os34]
MRPHEPIDTESPAAVKAWLQAAFAAQQAAFRRDPNPSAAQRRKHLRAIKRQLSRYQDVLAEAMSADFGFRAATESKMFDLLGSTLELNHLISHVGKWMKPSRRRPELLFISNSLEVVYQPKGVVGVIVPWNFPIYLAIGPLAAAIAAGNRVMLKMPEAASATGRTLARMLAEIFDETQVMVVYQKLPAYDLFSSLPFNHIVFTGSPSVGKTIMRAAAEHLTPVTLELGGKSPAVIGADYEIADAARRIAHGKISNAGQICVCPDYALVPAAKVEAFVAELQVAFTRMIGAHYASSPDYTSVVNLKQHRRLMEMLDDARAKGAVIRTCASYERERDGCRMPLHIVTRCTPGMLLMQEEIFGPVLPVLGYHTLEEAIEHIVAAARPLALYCFSHDASEQQRLLRSTHSGGVTINDWGWHVVNHDAPFGGVGNSGMGTYHGQEGFRELSHARTVFKRRRLFPTQLFHPPYGKLVQRLALGFFLGRPEPALRAEEEQHSGDAGEAANV